MVYFVCFNKHILYLCWLILSKRKMLGSICYVLFVLINIFFVVASEIPIVINTWHFPDANVEAWKVLRNDGTALDAVEQGASQCEILQCDGTVGYGGSPDEFGETRLDALIMDGRNMNVGAVGSMKRIKNAIAVARHVLDHTKHSILVGESATKFAVQMGFKEETLSTTKSKNLWKHWYNSDHCQPNFWVNVHPDPKTSCGPYSPEKLVLKKKVNSNSKINKYNHDTIGMIAIDKNGDIAAGTSTNGAKFKIPGRVGDSPIPGSGAYADNNVGGAAGTGDGDIMLRFSPSFFAVEEMRRGANPTDAARAAVRKIAQHYPEFSGAVIALTKDGQHGAACNNIDTFPYVVSSNNSDSYRIVNISCDMPSKHEL